MTGMFYKIVVRGELTERFSGAFEGMKMEAGSGQTTIAGEVVDQSHLHGLLNHICGLGLSLVSVQALPEDARGGVAQHETTPRKNIEI